MEHSVRRVLSLLAVLSLMGLAREARGAAPPVVDINTASVVELMQLPGLGRKRAEEIIRRRAAQPFRRTSELLRIRGIGRRTFMKLRPFVRVAPESTALVREPPAPAM